MKAECGSRLFQKEGRNRKRGQGREDWFRVGEQRLASRCFFPYDLRKKKMISESGRAFERGGNIVFSTFGGLMGFGGCSP